MDKTTVKISRSAKVGNKRFYGGSQVVSVEAAKALVEQGAAVILDKETKQELKPEGEQPIGKTRK